MTTIFDATMRLREKLLASTGARRTVISLRADARRRELIDRAAEVVGKNRTEFVLDAATHEATTVLLDRLFFELDGRAFQRFEAALDNPASENPRLRKLLAKKCPWDR